MTLNGFLLRYLSIGKELRSVYIKEQSVDGVHWVFVYNVPYKLNAESLQIVFLQFGEVVQIEELSSHAYRLRFDSNKAVLKLFSDASQTIAVNESLVAKPKLGTMLWVEEHIDKRKLTIDEKSGTQIVNDFLVSKREEAKLKKQEEIVTEDGFTLVTYNRKRKRPRNTFQQKKKVGYSRPQITYVI